MNNLPFKGIPSSYLQPETSWATGRPLKDDARTFLMGKDQSVSDISHRRPFSVCATIKNTDGWHMQRTAELAETWCSAYWLGVSLSDAIFLPATASILYLFEFVCLVYFCRMLIWHPFENKATKHDESWKYLATLTAGKKWGRQRYFLRWLDLFKHATSFKGHLMFWYFYLAGLPLLCKN